MAPLRIKSNSLKSHSLYVKFIFLILLNWSLHKITYLLNIIYHFIRKSKIKKEHITILRAINNFFNFINNSYISLVFTRKKQPHRGLLTPVWSFLLPLLEEKLVKNSLVSVNPLVELPFRVDSFYRYKNTFYILVKS